MRRLCKHLCIFENGTKEELESRLVSYKEEADARVLNEDSPEGRDGRKRSPRLLRLGAGSLGHFKESKQKARDMQPHSWPQPPLPPALPEYDMGNPAPKIRSTEFASLSPDTKAAREKAEAVRMSLSNQIAGADGPTNADLMAKLNKMSASMALKDDLVAAQLETVHRLRAAFQCEVALIREQLG